MFIVHTSSFISILVWHYEEGEQRSTISVLTRCSWVTLVTLHMQVIVFQLCICDTCS